MQADNWSWRVWYLGQRVIAAIALILLLPFFAVLYVLVRTTSRGPFLYRQTRPGLNGHLFQVVKIRTMTMGADRDRRLALSVRNDCPQVTRIGRVLRPLKLDELPQLWNVVRGDMALVGPRPIAPALSQKLAERIPGFQRRQSVRPGLSNLGQVCIEDNADAEHLLEDWRLRHEAERHYLRFRSIGYDFVIILLTVLYIVRKIIHRLYIRRLPRITPPQHRSSGETQYRTA